MRLSDKIKLACFNLMRRKKTTAQCVAMTTLIMLLVFVCAFFIATLSLQLNDSIENYASGNYIEVKSQNGDRITDSEAEALMSRFPTINRAARYYALGFVVSEPAHSPLVLDGEGYSGGAETDYWIDIIYSERGGETFAKNVYDEFDQKFGSRQLIKYGRGIQGDNEVLLPEQLLTAFNVTAEQILSAESVNYNNILTDVKIVGIIDARVAELGYYDGGLRFINIYADFSAIQPDYSFYNVVRYYLTGVSEVSPIQDYLTDAYKDYDYRIIGYGNYAIEARLELVGKLLIFTQDIIAVLIGVIGVALTVFLYSVLHYNAKQKGAYFGMMRAMGLKSTLPISLLEAALTTLVSAVLCFAAAVVTVSILNGAVITFSWLSRYTITVNAALFAVTFLLTLAVVAALNIVLTLLSSRNINKKTIVSALRG